MELSQQQREKIIDRLKAEGCFSAVVYGSYATGTATQTSDLDIFSIKESGDNYRIGEMWEGLALDVWIYSKTDLPSYESLIHIAEGRILFDQDDFGASLLKRLQEEKNKPVSPLPDWDIKMRIMWFEKMIKRAKIGDHEGNYRLHWLIFELLENWFAFRCIRFEGSKKSFETLRQEYPESYKIFGEALRPNATIDDVARLVKHVTDSR